jgi:hypothetical protein
MNTRGRMAAGKDGGHSACAHLPCLALCVPLSFLHRTMRCIIRSRRLGGPGTTAPILIVVVVVVLLSHPPLGDTPHLSGCPCQTLHSRL